MGKTGKEKPLKAPKKEQKILTTEEQAFIAKQQADKKAAKEYVATKIKPKKK
jgi:hypothetical protein